MRTRFVALLLLATSLSSSACIGRFAVTGEVRKFNLEVSKDQWGREIVFLCLYIIPIYPLAGAVDLIIVNSIEFWSGKNPVNGQPRLARSGDQRYVSAPDGSEAISTLRADGSIDLELRGTDGSVHFLNVVREGGGVVARDAEGRRIARVDSATGEIRPLTGSAGS